MPTILISERESQVKISCIPPQISYREEQDFISLATNAQSSCDRSFPQYALSLPFQR